MGFFSDYSDRSNNREGYIVAKSIFNSAGPGLSKDEIKSYVWGGESRWDRLDFYILGWYFRLCGKDYSYFFLYEWCFKDHPEWIERFKAVVDKDEDLDYIERISDDEDFFMFRPKEHSLGLELIVHNGLSPIDLNKRFSEVDIINTDYVDGYGPVRFSW